MSDVTPRRPSDNRLESAVRTLNEGGVIAYPTEAVFGLGCVPSHGSALRRIIDIKGRDTHKGFILIASSQGQLDDYLAPIRPSWQRQFDSHWPGPVTFVVPVASAWRNTLLTGYRDTLAVRVSQHPLVVELCDRFGGAIVSTSANRSGQPELRDTRAVRDALGSDVDDIIDGAVGTLANPTRIIDIVSGNQLR